MEILNNVNAAHVHLILNHIPIVGIPVVLIFLVSGVLLENNGLRQISLLFLIGLSATTIGVFSTGDGAEEILEKVSPAIEEFFIESHETASQVSLGLTLLMGIGAIHAYTRELRGYIGTGASKIAILLAFVASCSLGYTAYLGGKINHEELRAPSDLKHPESAKD